MNFVKMTVLALLLALPPMAMGSDPTLVPHRAEYKVKFSVASGRLNTELRGDDEAYTARYVVKPTGIAKVLVGGRMDVTSEFQVDDGGVRPTGFQSKDTIRNDPDVNLAFDWTTNQAVGTVGTDDAVFDIEGFAYDFVSLQYELMYDLLHGETDATYLIFDVDKMRVANVTRGETKKVKTRYGSFEAVSVSHQREGSSRVTTFWCVEELGYLPVIMEQHRKGKLNFRASLVKYAPL
ncbi:MAG: DUF3108 domain-containing protein [Pseudomonadota bacterium]